MKLKWTILLIVFALVMSLGFIISCGDDDDDDDDDDSGTPCEEYADACAASDYTICDDFYAWDDDCLLEAADALFECVGTDCEAYDDCSDQYLEDTGDC